MALKVATSLMQLSGFTQSAVELGKKWAWQGFSAYIRSPIEATRSVREMSAFMASRVDGQQRDVRDALAQFKGKGWRGDAARLMMLPIVKMQETVDIPTWLGAYNKAVAEGSEHEQAVRIADSFVEAAQGSGMMSSLSAFERGTWNQNFRLSEAIKLWTTFYSYFNTKLNIAMRKTMGTDFHSPAAVASLAADYLVLFWGDALIGDALVKLPGWLCWLFGGDEPADDEKTWMDYVAYGLWSGVSQLLGTLPFVREIASGIEGFGAAPGPSKGLGDVGSAAKSIWRTGESFFDPNQDSDWFALARHLVNGVNVGSPVKYPASQINTAISAMERASKGEDVPMIDYVIRPQK
jgi:hypothetical protein